MNDLKGFVSNKQALSVRRQCELLEINRSFVYYQPVKETEENLEIMQQMDREFLDHPTHGVLQMQDFLLTQGVNLIFIWPAYLIIILPSMYFPNNH